jgi:hypothetical protein
MTDEVLINWLESQRTTEGFERFWKLIKDQHKSRAGAAVARGDTEFEKGEAMALNWVENLPDDLLKTINKEN